jgi:hypothetical protein
MDLDISEAPEKDKEHLKMKMNTRRQSLPLMAAICSTLLLASAPNAFA